MVVSLHPGWYGIGLRADADTKLMINVIIVFFVLKIYMNQYAYIICINHFCIIVITCVESDCHNLIQTWSVADPTYVDGTAV